MKEFFLVHAPLVWFLCAVLFTLIEAMIMQLTTVWFALSALLLTFISFAPIRPVYQVLLFLIFSCLLLVLTRPFAIKKLNAYRTRTNVDSLIGKKAFVIKDIRKNKKGQVKAEGAVWTAQSGDGAEIETGSECIVERIEGVTLIVSAEKSGSADTGGSTKL